MKRLLTLITLLVPALMFSQAGEINWMSIEEAQAAQKNNPKKIMMDVFTQWCGPCKMLDKNTFQHADVASYVNQNYYAVKFDAESPKDIQYKGQTYSNPDYDPNKKGRNGVNQFSRAMGVSAYPTIIFLDEDLNVIAPIPGYKTPQQLEMYLKFFATDEYKSITTKEQWLSYQEGFKPEFK
jgi:thioredoxin-related protein